MNPFTEKAAVRLKTVNPLNADEDNVVRQRFAVHREEHFKRLIEFIDFCSTTRYLSLATACVFHTKEQDPGQ